jgi:hypothetical protein
MTPTATWTPNVLIRGLDKGEIDAVDKALAGAPAERLAHSGE